MRIHVSATLSSDPIEARETLALVIARNRFADRFFGKLDALLTQNLGYEAQVELIRNMRGDRDTLRRFDDAIEVRSSQAREGDED